MRRTVWLPRAQPVARPDWSRSWPSKSLPRSGSGSASCSLPSWKDVFLDRLSSGYKVSAFAACHSETLHRLGGGDRQRLRRRPPSKPPATRGRPPARPARWSAVDDASRWWARARKERAMFRDVIPFSSFSVDDLGAARRFYGETLGLDVSEEAMGGLLDPPRRWRSAVPLPEAQSRGRVVHGPELPDHRPRREPSAASSRQGSGSSATTSPTSRPTTTASCAEATARRSRGSRTRPATSSRSSAGKGHAPRVIPSGSIHSEEPCHDRRAHDRPRTRIRCAACAVDPDDVAGARPVARPRRATSTCSAARAASSSSATIPRRS